VLAAVALAFPEKPAALPEFLPSDAAFAAFRDVFFFWHFTGYFSNMAIALPY